MSENLSSAGHTVRSGETLLSIAQQHNVTLAELLAANPDITDPNLIRVGQTLNLPALAVAPAATASQPVATTAPAPVAVTAAPASGADPNAILSQFTSKGASDQTAKQDKLPQQGIHGVAASEAMAKFDRNRVIQHKDKFIAAGRLFDLPPALLAAIASRESRGGSQLVNGFGDGGHGFGLMQVDITKNAHVERDGGPAGQPHINQATQILHDKLVAVRNKFPSLTPVEQLQTAVSRYNGGHALPAPDSDQGTTGGDYMNDVWARARFYARTETWV
jgi:soluble lytic murein transglycosylase-like protein